MKFSAAVVAAVAAVMMAGGASAKTFSEPTITFSDLGGGDAVYSEDGFDFDPVSFQAGNCSPFPDNSDPCLKEVQQSGTITTMRSQTGSLFDLTGFYFDLQGQGTGPNALIVNSNKTDASSQLVFQIGENAPAGTTLYDNYSFSGGVLSGDLFSDGIVNNDSYFTEIFSSFFKGVSYVTWSTQNTQNVRIDDINASPVPLPAAGWLLLAGIGGLAALRRRKSV